MPLAAQVTTTPPPPRPDTVQLLTPIGVTVRHRDTTRTDTTHPPLMQRLTLPAIASVTAAQAARTVNAVDAEDAVKYLPSTFLRKRNFGDNQATIESRVWGVGSSARTLVFADGVPLTALIANNNTIGAPRWGLVSPNEIARIDVMYGPFSAAYAGNSMGEVMEITTRFPTRLEGGIEQTAAAQTFSLYGTDQTFGTSQTAGYLGDRLGRLSFWLSGNYQNSQSQPLSYVTSTSFPSGTAGGFAAQNKLGATANILGAGGLLHTGMTNLTGKVAYDLTPSLRATYTAGYWDNSSTSDAATYLTGAGAPTFASQSGFASGTNVLSEQHLAQSLSLRTDTHRDWDVEVVGSIYNFEHDRQNSPSAATADTTFNAAGKIAVLDGTGWRTLDVKGSWHAGGDSAIHTVSAGVHSDYYDLYNPTYNTLDWHGDATTTVATEGDGKTQTLAAWIQDRWRIRPDLALTVGGRLENWRAFDGLNVNGSTRVVQPFVSDNRFSPKGILAWTASPQWSFTGSVGKAYRFATASELYQLVSTGTTFTSPAPNLKPDDDLSTELRAARTTGRVRTQLSLFQDDVHDAIISQFLPLVPGSSTLYSYLSNVDHVRARGAELVLGTTDLGVPDLDINASATWVDARVLAISGQASAGATPGSDVGKRLPQIPEWRGDINAIYHPGNRWSLSLAGRYSGPLYTTLDNSDVNPNTYQGFSSWLVFDTRLTWRFGAHWTPSLGVDNLLDRKYFFFHPFPQRTFVGGLKYAF
jgi:iron complex outermembrane receptor protein